MRQARPAETVQTPVCLFLHPFLERLCPWPDAGETGRGDEVSGELNHLKTESDRVRRPLARILYVLSLLLMLAVAGITIWPEIEVMRFDRPLTYEERLLTLRCPLAVTRDENAALTATFTNDRDRNERFRAQARISYRSPAVVDEINHWVELTPGETKVVRWSLEPEYHAAYGRMILARVHISSRGITRPQQRGCGVMVLNLPYFTGTQYVAGMVVGGLLSLAASGIVWLPGRQLAQVREETATFRLAVLAVAVAAAMFAGLFNLGVLGGLLLIFSVLLVVSFIEHVTAE
jgi:hypothetical protein